MGWLQTSADPATYLSRPELIVTRSDQVPWSRGVTVCDDGWVSTDHAKEVDRQLMIWSGLYGPAKAGEMAAALRERLEDEPDANIATIVAQLDPEDEDWEESGLSRPGFG